MKKEQKAIVIGGGFYGLFLAEFLTRRFDCVELYERSDELMMRASYGNQARIHNGYHYPRSILTAWRSRHNFPRFVEEFSGAVDSSFLKVYAIARRLSKVTADQFEASMRRIGAKITKAPEPITKLFNVDTIEQAFQVEEYAFDALKLREIMRSRAEKAGVKIQCCATVECVTPFEQSVCVHFKGAHPIETVGQHVFNCTYSHLNFIQAEGSGGKRVALKHELAELALIEVPEALREIGITVMDGPFFSLMSFPARGLHSLSHVRYTPHGRWYDDPKEPYVSAYDRRDLYAKESSFPHMVRDAARYLPLARECVYRDSLWEVKTVLPRSESDDSRPIFFRPNHGIPGYHLVMGGKIDNVYDIVDVVEGMIDGRLS